MVAFRDEEKRNYSANQRENPDREADTFLICARLRLRSPNRISPRRDDQPGESDGDGSEFFTSLKDRLRHEVTIEPDDAFFQGGELNIGDTAVVQVIRIMYPGCSQLMIV